MKLPNKQDAANPTEASRLRFTRPQGWLVRRIMRIAPAKFGMLYIAVVFGVASFCGCWEWSPSNFNGDADEQWKGFHQLGPIWSPPTVSQIRQQFAEVTSADALIIRHNWTQWLAAILVAILPAFVLLTWLASQSFRGDRNLRFMVISMSGMYGGMMVWFVVWMFTAWRPPPILPYCGVGLVAGVVVATACRQWNQLGNQPLQAAVAETLR